MRKVAAFSFVSLSFLLGVSTIARAQTKSTDAGAAPVSPATPAHAAAPVAPPPPAVVPQALPTERPAPPMIGNGRRERDYEHEHEHTRDRDRDRDEPKAPRTADPDTSELKSGKLMRYGITAGVAAAVHVPFFGDTGVRGVGASALPYIAAFPALWTKSNVTRAYCTAKWIGEDGPENAATLAAVKEAISSLREETKRRGTQDLGAYYAPLHENAHDIEALPSEDAMNQRSKLWQTMRGEANGTVTPETEEAELVACEDSLKEATGSSDFPAACDTPHVHELIKAYADWDTKRSNRCAFTHLGGYVGLPFSYSANDNLGGHEESRRHTPFVSSGLVFAPSSFVSFLFGITLNNVTRGASAGTLAHDVTVPAFTFGLGGNLDMLGALLPGK
jgi:hypothetical protein